MIHWKASLKSCGVGFMNRLECNSLKLTVPGAEILVLKKMCCFFNFGVKKQNYMRKNAKTCSKSVGNCVFICRKKLTTEHKCNNVFEKCFIIQEDRRKHQCLFWISGILELNKRPTYVDLYFGFFCTEFTKWRISIHFYLIYKLVTEKFQNLKVKYLLEFMILQKRLFLICRQKKRYR